TDNLLDYGIDNFKKEEIFPVGYQLPDESTLTVDKGKNDSVDIATEKEVKMFIKDGDEENYSMKYHLDKDKINDEGEITAPVKKGEKVGTAEIVVEGEDFGYIFGEKDQQINLVATDSVEKSNWF